MKKIAALFIFLPLAAHSQHSYATLRGFDFNYSKYDPSIGAEFSLGGLFDKAGLGVGIAVIKIPNASEPYVPIFAEFTYFGASNKVSPYLNVQGGYGIYQNDFVKGGPYFHPNIGVAFPAKKLTKIILSAGYVSSDFSLKEYGRTGTLPLSSAISGFSLSIGAKF